MLDVRFFHFLDLNCFYVASALYWIIYIEIKYRWTLVYLSPNSEILNAANWHGTKLLQESLPSFCDNCFLIAYVDIDKMKRDTD